jgi:outer membrane protein OmpA-like peptidoglycan-associated protein
MKKILAISVVAAMAVQTAFAGNPDRRGEAGAPELNINGWARSAGFWGLDVASTKGLEAERNNPAGVAYTQKTEIAAAYTSWLTGSGINLVQGGFATRFKSNGVALSIQSLNFGSIDKTTTSQPEGGIGQFSPTFLNIGATYAKNFSLGSNKLMGDNVITGGLTARFVSEIVQNVTAFGVGFDIGLQYTTGKKENFHVGIALRNIGTPMQFSGDGFSYSSIDPDKAYSTTKDNKSHKFELPTQLNMGLAYDLYFGRKIELSPKKFTQHYRMTFMGQYSANAYGNDNYGFGVEFGLREMFMVRAAYRFENGIFSSSTLKTAYNGLAAGASVNIPFKKDRSGPSLGIDYGFRMCSPANNFSHTHTVGIRINLGGPDKQKVVSDKADAAPVDLDEARETKAEKRKGKKGKVTVEELEEKNAFIDSLTKVNQALKVKAETPVVKIDTVTVIKKEVIRDTIMLESSDYKGGYVDTITRDGKKVLQFNDYDALEFETGSDRIQTKSYSYLNYLVNIMKNNKSYKVAFAGHTDNVGDPAKNQKLSEDRVAAVKTYFVSKGIAADRVSTSAFGETKPKYPNDTAAHKAKNRRVEINMEM